MDDIPAAAPEPEHTTHAVSSAVTAGHTRTPSFRRARVHAWIMLGLIVLLAGLSIWLVRAPAAVSASATATEFSAQRAFAHVEVIARRPHPRGSPANAAVRDYIVDELRKLGLSPEIQHAAVVDRPGAAPVKVENILVRRAGLASTGAVLLSAHYDSVRTAPGAGDDGAAVGALLETLRALMAAPALRNDLIVLFTDGEEGGLFGATAFVREHPWKADVAIAFNFDARGTRGPVLMFETSAGNLGLVRALAQAAPHITAHSLFTFGYRHMPNGTDFTPLRDAGLAGLNFAFIGGAEHYHRPTDTPANLSRDTLQHIGHYTLPLARHFGTVTFPLPVEGDAVFFNLLGDHFIYYPLAWVKPLTIALLLLATAVSIFSLLSNRVSWKGVLGGWGAMLPPAMLSAGLGWLLIHFARTLIPWVGGRESLLVVGLGAGLASSVGMYLLIRRRLPRRTLAAAALWGWTLVASIAGLTIPEASPLMFWPALLGWLAVAVVRVVENKRPDSDLCALSLRWLFAVPVASAVILISPLLALGWIALPPALPILAAGTGFLTWNVLLLTEEILPRRLGRA